jgi:GMP synthase-like glutamine amidotransferase
VRLGLLLCDHVRPGFQAIAGDYPQIFSDFLAPHPDIEVVTYDLTVGEFPADLDACDAWIGSGSRHSVYEPIPWVEQLAGLIRRFDVERRRYVGICFGAQMIGHALDGRVARAPQGWQVGIKEVALTQSRPWMHPPASTLRILHSNADQIIEPPDRVEVVGTSETVPVAMVVVGDHFLGFQGHPEFSVQYSAVLAEARRDVLIPGEVVDAGLASLTVGPDRDLLRSWIVEFLTH